MVRIFLGVAAASLMAAPATAQMTGYSVDYETGVVSTFSCPYGASWDCYRDRTELGTIDGLIPWVTTMAPSGELVAWDEDARELVWIDVPSLDIVTRLAVDSAPPFGGFYGLAFDRNGVLWATHGFDLYTIDTAAGDARLELQSEYFIDPIAFVGDRLFGAFYNELYEIDVLTGEARLVAHYFGSTSYNILHLAAHDGRLWSLGYEPPLPPFPPGIINWISTHDLETGDLVFQGPFDDGEGHTLALVSVPEQQPGAVPGLGQCGLIVLASLIGLAGVLLSRRII